MTKAQQSFQQKQRADLARKILQEIKKDNASYKVVESLIHRGADLNYKVSGFKLSPQSQPESLIAFAILHDHDNIVRLLLKNGANPNQTWGVAKEPVLTLAIRTQKPDIMETLIKASADIHLQGKSSKSAVDYALASKDEHCRKVIDEALAKELQQHKLKVKLIGEQVVRPQSPIQRRAFLRVRPTR